MKLLKFSADWCVPCKDLSKYLDDLGVEYLEITMSDYTKDQFVRYNIRSVPSLVLVNGEDYFLDKVTGFNKGAIDDFLNRYGLA